MSTTSDKNIQYTLLNTKYLWGEISALVNLMILNIERSKLEGSDTATIYFDSLSIEAARLARDILETSGLDVSLDVIKDKLVVTW